MPAPTWGPGKYGTVAAAASGATLPSPNSTQLAAVPSHSTGTLTGTAADLLQPGNPLVAFGVIAALAFGLMAVSTSVGVRVGHENASAGFKIGDTK